MHYSLGENIVRYRNVKGLSRKEFSELTGISTSTICKIEQNKSMSNLRTLSKIVDATNIPYDYLIGIDTKAHKILTAYLFTVEIQKALQLDENANITKLFRHIINDDWEGIDWNLHE